MESGPKSKPAYFRNNFFRCQLTFIKIILVHVHLPEDVTSSRSKNTFCRQLKTWILKMFFPDIIIWYWLHLDWTFSLDLSLSTLRRFCRLRTTIWYDMIWCCKNKKGTMIDWFTHPFCCSPCRNSLPHFWTLACPRIYSAAQNRQTRRG